MEKPDALHPVVDALRLRLGDMAVVSDAAGLAEHLIEPRGLYQGQALAAVFPRTTEEVSLCVRICAEAGVPVVPHGGNTGLVGGGVPQGGVVLSLTKLDQVRSIDPLNATVTVDGGCILQKVQEAADEAGFLFPLSLASEGSCRIGGNLATNAGGTAVLRYGNMRELALGLEVVLADGRIWHGLKGLRKDNTGYDLRDLFIGSEGTLGIITGAVLKLFPKPKTRTTAFIGCAGPHEALGVFERFRAVAGGYLTAFEYIPRFGLEIVLRHVPGAVKPLADAHHSYALIELSSPQAQSDLQGIMETVLASAIEDGLVEDATVGASEGQNKALWLLREMLSDVQAREGGSIKHDVAVPVSRVADFIVTATLACERALEGLRVCAFGHFGDGNIHFNLSQPVGMDRPDFLSRWQQFNRIVHDIVDGMDGSIAAEHGIGMIKRGELALYKDPVALDMMRAVKQALDPRNIMNPGKVLPEPSPALPSS
jgi:FAD/FMN-containing dehydrogenase